MGNEVALKTGDGFVPATLDELMKFAKIMSESTLVPSALRNKPGDCAIVMMTGREMGLQPMQAMRLLNVIEGKCQASADLMAGMVQGKSVCEYLTVIESTTTKAIMETRRRGSPNAVRMEYTIEQAQKAGLASKQNWTKDAQAMLLARCKTRICRAVYSDIVGGFYSDDEIDDVVATARERIVGTIDPSVIAGNAPASVVPNTEWEEARVKDAPGDAQPATEQVADATPTSNPTGSLISQGQMRMLHAVAKEAATETGIAIEIVLKRALVAHGYQSRKEIAPDKFEDVVNWIKQYDPKIDGATMPDESTPAVTVSADPNRGHDATMPQAASAAPQVGLGIDDAEKGAGD